MAASVDTPAHDLERETVLATVDGLTRRGARLARSRGVDAGTWAGQVMATLAVEMAEEAYRAGMTPERARTAAEDLGILFACRLVERFTAIGHQQARADTPSNTSPSPE